MDFRAIGKRAERRGETGIVDFRITRIDEEWSGLRFTIRK
jgi:hypothetical protein